MECRVKSVVNSLFNGHRQITLASKRKSSDRQHRYGNPGETSLDGQPSQTTASVGTQTHNDAIVGGASSQCCSAPSACDTHSASAAMHQSLGATGISSYRSPLLPREPTALRISDKEMLTTITTATPATASSGDRDDAKETPRDAVVKETVVPLEPRRPTSSPVRHTPLENSFAGNAERRARLKSDNNSGVIAAKKSHENANKANENLEQPKTQATANIRKEIESRDDMMTLKGHSRDTLVLKGQPRATLEVCGGKNEIRRRQSSAAAIASYNAARRND